MKKRTENEKFLVKGQGLLLFMFIVVLEVLIIFLTITKSKNNLYVIKIKRLQNQ